MSISNGWDDEDVFAEYVQLFYHTNLCILTASAHPAVQNPITHGHQRSRSPLRLYLMMRWIFGHPSRMTVIQRIPLRNGGYKCIIPNRVVLNDFLSARLGKGKTAVNGFFTDEHDTYLEDYATRYALFIVPTFLFWLTSMSV